MLKKRKQGPPQLERCTWSIVCLNSLKVTYPLKNTVVALSTFTDVWVFGLTYTDILERSKTFRLLPVHLLLQHFVVGAGEEMFRYLKIILRQRIKVISSQMLAQLILTIPVSYSFSSGPFVSSRFTVWCNWWHKF